MATTIKEGDYIFVKDNVNLLDDPVGWRLEVYKGIYRRYIQTSLKCYVYCVPFKHFNPKNMEATLRAVWKVRNGQLIKVFEP